MSPGKRAFHFTSTAVAFAAVLMLSSPAAAIAVACGWFADDNPPISDLALDAPVPIQATIYSDCGGEPLDAVTAVVTNEAGATVGGTLGFNPVNSRLFWTSNNPLEPASTYTLLTNFDNAKVSGWFGDAFDITVTFTTGEGPLTPPTAASLTESTLTEKRNADTECCEPVVTCSGSGQCDYCWANSYSYVPAVQLTFRAAAEPVYAYYHRIASGASEGAMTATSYTFRTDDNATDYEALVAFAADALSGPACVRVDTISVVDDSVVASSPVVCHEAAEQVALAREEVPVPDFSQCVDPSRYADHPLNPSAAADDGCATGHTPGWPLACIMAALLLGWRQRDKPLQT